MTNRQTQLLDSSSKKSKPMATKSQKQIALGVLSNKEIKSYKQLVSAGVNNPLATIHDLMADGYQIKVSPRNKLFEAKHEGYNYQLVGKAARLVVGAAHRYHTGVNNQCALILNLLMNKGNLNTFELKALGITNPAQRIYELRKRFIIETVREDFLDSEHSLHKRTARYFMRGIKNDFAK